MQFWHLGNDRAAPNTRLDVGDDFPAIAVLIQQAECPCEGDVGDDVECPPLQPFAEVDRWAG